MHVCVGVMTAVWECVVMLHDYYDARWLVQLFFEIDFFLSQITCQVELNVHNRPGSASTHIRNRLYVRSNAKQYRQHAPPRKTRLFIHL